MRPPIPSLTLSRRSKIALSVVGVLVVLLIVLLRLTGVYVDWLWFGTLHYREVFTGILWTRITLFLIFGVAMALIVGGNLVIAYLLRPPFRPMSAEQQNLEHYRSILEPRRKLILAAVMLIALLASGLSAQGNWSTWLLWLNGGEFGQKDPQFHRDISFYAWDYPAYRLMLAFGFSAVLFALVLSIAVHYLSGAIRLQTPGPKVTPAARRHITLLVFAFMALKAVAYWLDRYGLVFSDRSKFTGASYTDVHAVLGAKTILFWITIVLALGVLASLWLRSALLPGIGFIVLMVLSVLISGIYPAVVQQVSVKPNASDKEALYIGRNIEATRQAYNIETRDDANPNGTVSYRSYPVASTPDPAALKSDNATIANIRILDPNVVSPTFLQKQKVRNPYGFAPNLDMDRYTIDGVEHDYVVGVREMSESSLTGNLGNWINSHTVYTHGYGFVAAKADKDVTNGVPEDFTIGGLPPTGPASLKLDQPRVYYGETMPNYSIVGAQGTPREFDGSNTETFTYDGAGGVSLGNIFNRLAFAVHFKEPNFVLNDAVSAKGARVIFDREPRERVQKVAPFLTVDGDPYPVIADGRVVWIVDAYTTMANYPYSERRSLSELTHTSVAQTQKDTEINYIRNSVKATVDAYDGTVTLYQWDGNDPVLKAWMKAFPNLIKPGSDMPQDIREHVRYPQDFFDVQRSLLEQYHVSDPVTFYNVRDKWTVPNDPNHPGAGNQPPYYILADAPDGSGGQPQFQLTSPMLVNNSTNLAAFISANSDPGPNYGKMTVLVVDNKSAIQGPEQIANVFKTNSKISSDITLLSQGQSQVIHGNLLTLPIGDSFLYVEPLYVQATYPTLQRVLVTYGEKIGYGATLAAALSDLQPGHTTGQTLQLGSTTGEDNGPSTPPSSPTPTPTTSAPSTSAPPTTSVPPDQRQLLAELNSAFAQFEAAQRSGDFAAAGAAQGKVNQLLQQYLSRFGTLPSGTPTPSGSPSS
jgi:uncharacterized membrane protein (UPF0182 family)